ncbi:MAG TPA: hypothetical protein IAA32_05335, partial [Candidatus Butyricicoccus stercorigallinarum]|nr:hypothetical protein [Candidatus Butyricicoccus stercorigallinarum]
MMRKNTRDLAKIAGISVFPKRGRRSGSPANNGRKKAGNPVADFLPGVPSFPAAIPLSMTLFCNNKKFM